MRREWIIGCLLAALTVAVYWPARHYDFVCYDDSTMLLQNPAVMGGLTMHGLAWALTTSWFEYWHPITWLSHMLDFELFGPNPGGHHLVSVAFHTLNALLLFLVLREVTGSFWRSAIVAAFFALHPLRVESVAWIAERKDLLGGCFFLLTIWAYGRYVGCGMRNPQAGSPASRFTFHVSRYYLLALLFFALGLMSKPMVVTLPFVLLLLDFWPLGRLELPRFEVPGPAPVPGQRLRVWRAVLEKLPFFALSAVFSAATPLMLAGRPVNDMVENIRLTDRLVNAVVSYYRYLAKSFWPTNLAVLYPHPASHYPVSDHWPAWQVAAMLLLLLAVTAFCLYEFRRWPFLAVGWFWYLGTLVPVIGLVQVGAQAMADRYTYLPLIGPVLGLVWFLSELVLPSRTSPARLPLTTNLNVGQCVSPALSSAGQPQGGAGETHCPTLTSARLSGSKSSPCMGKWALAALTLLALSACAVGTRHQLQYWRNSLTLFEHTVEVTPDNPVAQSNLGLALATADKPEQAIIRYRVALAIRPRNALTHFNLGELLRRRGEWQAAAQQFETAIRLNPRSDLLHLLLADVLIQLGRAKEAAGQIDEALRLNPRLPPEHLNNFAWALATGGRAENRDGPHAVRFAERACELTQYKVPVFIGTLAATYAEAGRFPEAVTTAEMACTLAQLNGEQAALEKNRRLLELYRGGKPYHEPAATTEENHR